MKKVRITVMCRAEHTDLMEKYENPLENPCEMTVGDVFVSVNAEKPDGMCSVAWGCSSTASTFLWRSSTMFSKSGTPHRLPNLSRWPANDRTACLIRF